jgi:4,5-DOPA dioxygenase extradiol
MIPPADALAKPPVLFVGHGSPMNAIETNPWTQGWRQLAADLPKYRAILSISAHWTPAQTQVTSESQPRTIHDFGGFPRELFAVQYPAPGDPVLAQQVLALVSGFGGKGSTQWGLDHGTWSVLKVMREAADIPVVQLGMNRHCTPREHLAIGRALAPLRDEGVLILASGNLTHNLSHALRAGDQPTPEWARTFDQRMADALTQGDEETIVAALDTREGKMSHPSAEHFWPLLYALGSAGRASRITFPVEGFDHSSLSMRCARFD